MGGFNRYAIYRQTKELKRRDKEFANNVGYGEVQNDWGTDETEDYADITIQTKTPDKLDSIQTKTPDKLDSILRKMKKEKTLKTLKLWASKIITKKNK